jgi:hypothetical protein
VITINELSEYEERYRKAKSFVYVGSLVNFALFGCFVYLLKHEGSGLLEAVTISLIVLNILFVAYYAVQRRPLRRYLKSQRAGLDIPYLGPTAIWKRSSLFTKLFSTLGIFLLSAFILVLLYMLIGASFKGSAFEGAFHIIMPVSLLVALGFWLLFAAWLIYKKVRGVDDDNRP